MSKELAGLLPAIYRPATPGKILALRALLSAIWPARYSPVLDEGLERLYDDQFIETCPSGWSALYRRRLIGYRAVHGLTRSLLSSRAEVATYHPIPPARVSGDARDLARDVTGCGARVVEMFAHLAARHI